ncbi:MAG: hypothetical protein JSR59_11870 [Proteobacteria bacterium]|nr:hypothetical protein [Pseudomonadota bacterium]
MIPPEIALRGGAAGQRVRAAASIDASTVVVGGGGTLGSAVLEGLLAARGNGRVHVLATRALRSSADGLDALVGASLESPYPALPLGRTGVVVFDRARHANGRDNAFLRPQPADLVGCARWLHGAGVRHLLVVLPVDPARMPLALRAGLAGLDEHAVAALGFEHVVFVRPAELAGAAPATARLQRLAHAVLAQWRLMLPQSQQPVRVRQVAAWVVALARELPGSPSGTRVAAPELVWLAAQGRDMRRLAAAWLAGDELPPPHLPRRRM